MTTHGMRCIQGLWLHVERLDITTGANEGLTAERLWYGYVVLWFWLDVEAVLRTRGVNELGSSPPRHAGTHRGRARGAEDVFFGVHGGLELLLPRLLRAAAGRVFGGKIVENGRHLAPFKRATAPPLITSV